jgi:MinD-like ATPase involved in chromosome partitioning or flagellar assembly
MRLAVLTAAEGAGWEERFVAALARDSHGVEIVRRCVDVVDLLAVAASGQGRIALISATLRRLDADVVDRLLAAEVVPVAVVPREDEVAEARVRALGFAHVVPTDIEAAVLAGVLVEAVRDSGVPPEARHAFADSSVPLGSGPVGDAAADAPPETDEAPRRGSVVAVWGPTGAPGRTTVAVALADELARLNREALLVDADVYGGTVAPVLGLLDESPGLAAACRMAGATGLTPAALAELAWQVSPKLRVLTGIPLASRWPELRPAAVSSVLAAARTLADWVVVDCGFSLEAEEELSFDTLAPRRNGATLTVLDDADLVLVVGAADPIGMQRVVRALAELRDAEIAAPVWVVLNRVRPGVVPGDHEAELRGALERFAGRSPAALLPYDRKTLDAAGATGRLLAEVDGGAPLRRAVGELAAAVAGVPAPGGRRRVRKWRGSRAGA